MQIRLLLIILGFCSLDVYADEIPTLDLSENHSYSQIAKGGILVDKPPRGSQGILNKEFKIKITNGKELTISSGALLYCAPGDTNIQFVAFNASYSTVEETKQEIAKLSDFFGWITNDFSEWIDKAEKPKWFKVEEEKPPCYVVEVSRHGLKETSQGLVETPYAISITLTWNANILERQNPEAGMFRRKKEYEAVVASAKTDAPIAIPQSPEKIVKFYLDLQGKKDFGQMARLLDANGVNEFRQTLSYFDHGSGSEFGDQLRKAYFGANATTNDISKLSDEEFIAKWFEMQGMIATTLMGVNPDSASNTEFIGSLPEGAKKLHVLIRMHNGKDPYTGKSTSNVIVVSLLKQVDGSWKIELPDDVLNSAEEFAKRIAEH